jgi:hypothetical protein
VVVVRNVEGLFELLVRLSEVICVSRRSVQREFVRRPGLILSQEIDDLMVKCNDMLCSWVGKKGDYIAHWMAACPIRRTPWRGFTPFYDVPQGTESDLTLVAESRESSLSAHSPQFTSFRL